jgi:PTH1 family peptidyl-tRNA hydrolase
VTEQFIKGQKIVLLKPTTFYNLSGESVKAMKDFYKLKNTAITVIHDELDLPFGTVKEKNGGGSAGSNGLKSIISLIGADFKRIRIGISNELKDKMDAADFVLKKFSAAEKKQLEEVIQTALTNLS